MEETSIPDIDKSAQINAEQEEIYANELQNYSLDVEELRLSCYTNYDTYVATIASDILEHDIAQYQVDVFWQFVSDTMPKYAVAIPRGHIKTTLAKLALVWRLIYSKDTFGLYVSGTHSLAENNAADIVNFMKSSIFASVWGKVTWHRYREKDGDYIFTLTAYRWDAKENKLVSFQKRGTIQSRSTGQSIRGLVIGNRRPDYVIMDDIDQDDKLASDTSYDKIKDWVYSVLLKIGNKNTKFRQIGNFIKTRCVIGDHIMSSAWGSMHYSAIKPDGEPLWPSLWNIESLTADFKEYQAQNRADTWMAEMLNNPFENVSGRIKYNDIKFLPEVIPKGNNYRSVFITVDPAISKSKRANKTAICVHAYNIAYEKWQLIEVVSEQGMDPETTYSKLMELTLKWGATKWFIESVAYQAALQTIYSRYLAATGLNVTVHPSPRVVRTKNERILGWFSMLRTGEYALTEGMLGVANEIISFRAETKDNQDDVIDAASDVVVIKAQFEGQLDGEFGMPIHMQDRTYAPVARYVLNS